LRRSDTLEGPAYDTVLGPDLAAGQFPQLVVEADHWQAARSTGDYTLVGCTVSPGFEFAGFELTDHDFNISTFQPKRLSRAKPTARQRQSHACRAWKGRVQAAGAPNGQIGKRLRFHHITIKPHIIHIADLHW